MSSCWAALAVNAHAGTRYGIPFPGLRPRRLRPARRLIFPRCCRSVVACGWFGIQTWIGGLAISEILGIVWPVWRGLGDGWSLLGFGLPDYLGFLLFWLINLWFVWKGTESIKWLETLSAPFLIVVGLALLWWAAAKVGGLGVILARADGPGKPDSRPPSGKLPSGAVPALGHRDGGILGHALRSAFPISPASPGASASRSSVRRLGLLDYHAAVRLHRHRGHQRHRDSLRDRDLEPGRSGGPAGGGAGQPGCWRWWPWWRFWWRRSPPVSPRISWRRPTAISNLSPRRLTARAGGRDRRDHRGR